MNKRDLIKALFKNPTIKALYESGHFNATDINRAILTEASESEKAPMDNTEPDDKGGVESTTTDAKEDSQKQKKEYLSLAKLIVSTNTLINKPEYVKKQAEFLKSLDDENFLKELVLAYLKESNKTDQTNTVDGLIDKYAGDESIKSLQQQIAKLKASLDKIQGKSATPSEEPSNPSVNEYVNGLANEFDEKVSKQLQLELERLIEREGITVTKAFIMYAIKGEEKLQESEEGGQTDLFMSQKVEPFLAAAGLEENQRIKDFLGQLVSKQNIQDIYAAIDKEINLPQDDVPTDDSTEEDLKQKRQQLANRASAALSVLNVKDSELLKNDVFMIFMGSVLEKEGVIREAEEQLESYVEKYIPQLEDEETRKEFYITQEEVGDLKTFLSANKDNVDKIITAAIKATKDNKDPNMDDESPPELAELQENWNEVLMTFFGKNPKKSSFMRRLLLRSQAQMLYGVMDVLEQISDPEQMSAYTDMNQDDEREKQADKAKEPELQKEGSLGDAMKKAEEEEQEKEFRAQQLKNQESELKAVQRASMQKAAQDFTTEPKQKEEPEVQQDKVELPAKTRRIIKQDLQSMVDLLRQLKLAIKDYSMYATRKSADPRFDGSKLKANMDELLVQVQDDIYDLHSNLKPADLAPEPDDENIEEALNGIMLEEDDPERQAKIQLVRETYDNAKREYIYVLMPSMEEPNWSKSQASAKKILDILKEEKFISLFPTGMKTAGGKVMTVGKAYESMTAVIQEFVETVRNIVLISKKKYISKPSLTEAKNKLKKISIEIAELFRVPSKFSPEEIKQAKEEEATNPDNQALTPEPAEKLEQKEEDNAPSPSTPDTPVDGTDTEEESREQLTYSKDIKNQLQLDLDENEPLILDYFSILAKELFKLLNVKSPLEENAFSGVRKFAKGVKRSLTTDDSEAYKQVFNSINYDFEGNKPLKSIIFTALSSHPNKRKFLSKYDFKQIGAKTTDFFEKFDRLVDFVRDPDYTSINPIPLAKELQRVGDIDSIRTDDEGGDQRSPIDVEEFKSLLEKYKQRSIEPRSADLKTLINGLGGKYGQKVSDFLISKYTPKLTTEGVKDAREKEEKGDRLAKALANMVEETKAATDPKFPTGRYKTIIGDIEQDKVSRGKLLREYKDLVNQISSLGSSEERATISSLEKGNLPTNPQVKGRIKEVMKFIPDFLSLKKDLKPPFEIKFFLESFIKPVKKNPDLIPSEDDLEFNILDYYEEYLTNEDTLLGPMEMYDLKLLKDNPAKETSEIAFEDLTELNKRGMQALLKKVDIKDLPKALKNVSPEILEFFLSHLSKRQAQDVREEIEFAGSNPSEQKEAKQRITTIAQRLKEQGVIYLDKKGSEGGTVEEALKPIIATMLKEHYNH